MTDVPVDSLMVCMNCNLWYVVDREGGRFNILLGPYPSMEEANVAMASFRSGRDRAKGPQI